MKKILLFTAALCCSVALNAGLVRIGYITPTDQNANDLLAESNFSSTGNASYNKTTRTLTLTNCVVDSSAVWDFQIEAEDTLTINLVGVNRLNNAYFVRQPHISKTLLLRFTGAGSLYVTYSGVPMQPEKTTLDISADVTLRTWKSNCAFGADSVMMKKVWIETPANGYLSEFYSSSRKTMYSPDGSYAKLVHFANDNSKQRGIEVEGFMLTENQNYNPWQPDVVYDESLQGLKVNSTTLTAKNNYACIADYGSTPLKIYLNDKVDAVLLEDGLSAIESQNANVYIYGPGSLTINNGNYGAGIYLDEYDLTIAQNATVNIISETDQSMGISLAGGALTVDKANLTVQGYPSLMGVSNLTMNGGVGILSKGHTFSTTKQSIVDATGEATNEQVVIAIDPTGVDDVSSDSGNGQVESVKVLQDGQLLILRGGKTYNLLGVEVW